MTQRKDSAYTNGVIAVREKRLLKDKLVKACAASEEEAMRLFFESGFGGSDFSLDAENAVLADERETDAFIREYAPSREAVEYLLAPRDFHNAKAVVKSSYLNCDETPFVGSEGNFSLAELKKAIETGEKNSSAQSKRRGLYCRANLPRARKSDFCSIKRSMLICCG